MAETITEEKSQAQHQLVRRGPSASCTCGAWECRTNEVVEADTLKTLQKQYSMHLADQAEPR